MAGKQGSTKTSSTPNFEAGGRPEGSPQGVDNPDTIKNAGGDSTPRLDRIARRAYEIYQSRGGENGRSLEDWLEAEREIDGQE